jgi:hypothetical protein
MDPQYRWACLDVLNNVHENTFQCTVEGYALVFQAYPPPPDGSVGKEYYAQVEVGGQILGKGVALTWEEAKLSFKKKAKLQVLSSFMLKVSIYFPFVSLVPCPKIFI